MDRPGDRQPPRGLLRNLLRFPTVLYRFQLGWLLGRSHLLLRHRGRRSGAVRRTVLEVMAFDPGTQERVVASYWGERSDWWRNVRAGGALEVVGLGGRFVPAVRFLDLDERIRALHRYRTQRPAWAWLGAVAFGLPRGRDPATIAQIASILPMIALAPTDQ